MAITTCVFDAYGTLFDVNAAAREAAAEPGREALAESWERIAHDWRLKQLQYTWIRAITGEHADFWQVTQDGLDWALEAAGLDDPELRDRLLALYRNLSAFPEVPDVLASLKQAGKTCAILSNGSPDMLESAVASAGIVDHLNALLSVEEVGVFKPDARVYDLVAMHLGCQPGQVLFVSSNGWDAASATGYGFTTAWVNRAGEPVDRLPARPHHVLSDLSTIPDLA
ncbi:haloacid dehalogenase type II [Tranquillimonas alkanivorans]|uniref:(S)-2-haloacid dehalogenase n=1 Tax=Tranquillimonas alkanivorans TaxID=441119 RepID=A0A1I5KRM1_9RHOB|nr:haloacid dehalogenase type II [Tranquillimonas alkanivorans]SFO87729.1 2-haloacid dehalogenase [Tranquillimonas alkanivorans]